MRPCRARSIRRRIDALVFGAMVTLSILSLRGTDLAAATPAAPLRPATSGHSAADYSRGVWRICRGATLFEHALAPMADFPVREIVSASHIVTDLTLARAKRCHDYLENAR